MGDFLREFNFGEVCTVSSGLPIEDCEVDFGQNVKRKLTDLIEEVNKTPINSIQDDYNVRVNISDKSIYAYAPRKFALEERRQIREITDDLLERGIMKYSTSPYCARVVAVRMVGLVRMVCFGCA